MKKLDLYLIRKFLGTFFFILLIILVVSIVVDVSEKIEDFIERKPPLNELIFTYYFDFILFYGNLLSPICIFLAVIYFTSRLTTHTEIVAMLSGGISFYRILRPYMLTAFFLAGLSFYLNAYLVPIAVGERIDFEYKYLKNRIVMRDVNIHKKVADNDAERSECFVFFYSYNQLVKEGYLFTMENIRNGDIVTKISGDKATWIEEDSLWRIEQVRVHDFLPDGKERIRNLARLDTTFLLTPDDIFIKEMRAESMPLGALSRGIQLEQMRGSGLADELIKEKYERYAYPFAAIILTLIGFSVSTKKRRGGTALQMGIGLLISFLYIGLVAVSGEALFGASVPVWFGIWFPNLLFFGVAMVMLRLAPK